MLKNVFKGVFDSDLTTLIRPGTFLLCLGVSLALGLGMALAYMYRSRYTKSFVATLALLPAVVCIVIMLVNGNVGAGVAVAGAFSLVRFRSVPGTAKEICALFLAMGTGLITGMGYLGFGVLFALIMSGMFMVYNLLDLGEKKQSQLYKTLTVTIPEDLDYTGIFEDIFRDCTVRCQLVRVRTTNLGSLFRLTYELQLKDISKEKELIDRLRERNGNLEISVSRQESSPAEL